MLSMQKFQSQQKTATNKYLLAKIKNEWNRILTKSFPDALDPDLNYYLQDVSIYHVNKDAVGPLKSANFPEKGFTALVFTTASGSYYSFTVCNDSESVFDRKAGVYQAYRKTLSQGVLSFAQLGINEEQLKASALKTNGAVTANQLFVKTLGYYLLNATLPVKESKPQPLSVSQCNTLTASLMNVLIPQLAQPGVDIQVQFSQIRLARDEEGRVGLATSSFLKNTYKGKYELSSKSGLTLFIVTCTKQETGQQIVLTSFAKCSEKDVFNKAMGRLVAIRQLAKNGGYELQVEAGKDAFKETINFYSELFTQHITC